MLPTQLNSIAVTGIKGLSNINISKDANQNSYL